MTEETLRASCVIDTSGLHAIATVSGNLKTILLEKMKNGDIAVPTWAWQEFQKLYRDEAADLAPYVITKISMKRAVLVGAARITEKLNLGLSRGRYDNHIELYTASIASNNGYTVLTSTDQVSEYRKMDCDVSDLETWVVLLLC